MRPGQLVQQRAADQRGGVGAAHPAAEQPVGQQRADLVTGQLAADWLIRRGVRGTYASSLVSGSLMHAIAEAHGVASEETPTGFKWIMQAGSEQAPLVYGYEEALGYSVAPSVVKDKDGISAALAVALLAAELKADGRSVLDRLDELAN